MLTLYILEYIYIGSLEWLTHISVIQRVRKKYRVEYHRENNNISWLKNKNMLIIFCAQKYSQASYQYNLDFIWKYFLIHFFLLLFTIM